MEAIGDKAHWEFFSSWDVHGNAVWEQGDIGKAAPIITWNNHTVSAHALPHPVPPGDAYAGMRHLETIPCALPNIVEHCLALPSTA